MSDVKWTPGPWTWDAALDHNWDVQVWSSPSRRVCFVAHDGEDGNPTGQANACLISAAPDMYEALVAAIECGMVPTSSATEGGALKHVRQVHVADQIRAALAKARGETP